MARQPKLSLLSVAKVATGYDGEHENVLMNTSWISLYGHPIYLAGCLCISASKDELADGERPWNPSVIGFSYGHNA